MIDAAKAGKSNAKDSSGTAPQAELSKEHHKGNFMGEEARTLSSPESSPTITRQQSGQLSWERVREHSHHHKLTRTCPSRLCTAHSRPQLLEDALTTRSSDYQSRSCTRPAVCREIPQIKRSNLNAVGCKNAATVLSRSEKMKGTDPLMTPADIAGVTWVTGDFVDIGARTAHAHDGHIQC